MVQEQYAIIPGEEYRVEYNQSLNEYYLYTNDDYIDLKLYLNKDVYQIIENDQSFIVYIISEQ